MFHSTVEQNFGSIELIIALDANVTTFLSQTPLFISSIASGLAVLPSQVRTVYFAMRSAFSILSCRLLENEPCKLFCATKSKYHTF